MVTGKRQSEEIRERSDWERTRWQTALLLNVHTKKGAKITPKDLAIFPWEKADKKKPQLDGLRMLKSLVKNKK